LVLITLVCICRIGVKEKMAEEKKKQEHCPLKATEWIQFLNNVDSRLTASCNYHHSSVLSDMAIELAITSIILVFVTLAFMISDYRTPLFNFLYLIFIAIFLTFEFKVIRKFRRLFNAIGIGINNISNQIDEIIEDIIDGKLKDTNEIRKRYRDIDWQDF
jgi:ABC-type multidrug transport system fused ATPase/permease subunit